MTRTNQPNHHEDNASKNSAAEKAANLAVKGALVGMISLGAMQTTIFDKIMKSVKHAHRLEDKMPNKKVATPDKNEAHVKGVKEFNDYHASHQKAYKNIDPSEAARLKNEEEQQQRFEKLFDDQDKGKNLPPRSPLD